MKRHTVIRLGIILAIVFSLELVSRMGWVRTGLLTPPTAMVAELWRLMQTAPFWNSVGTSSRAIAMAFVSAIVLGSIAGLVLHAFPRVRGAIEPLVSSYYALPFFALYPLLIVLMGMNQKPIVLIGFLYAFMAIIIGVLNGLDRIPAVLRRTGESFRMGRLQQAWYISMPAAAPYIFTGAKLAFGYSITGVIGSEFILADSGFGYDIAFAYNNFEDKKMYALLLFLLLVVSLLTALIYRAERAVQHRSGSAHAGSERKPASALSKAAAAAIVAAILLGLWQFTHDRVGDEVLAAPLQTLKHVGTLIGTDNFHGHVAETFKALGLSLLISCVAGAVLGALVGMSATATRVASPMLVTLYALPKVALYPLVLLFFGIGLTAKVVFGAMYGLIPMMLIVINAIQSMNHTLPKTARVMRLSRAQTISTVIIPAMVPEVVTGVRISFSITFLGVMIGEMFASSRGLGHLMMNSINVNDTATIMGVFVLIALFAVITNAALMAAERAINRT
ncbi:MAG: ABC transporter permease subunit [Variovorax sp.]|nr:MAG: ABC transporter permease subunit [Variovorax sp.]